MENLAEILKQIRLKSGVSQAEFAKQIGVSQRTWSAYESGETRPKVATLLALSSMGYEIPDVNLGAYQGSETTGSAGAALRQLEAEKEISSVQNFDIFRLKHGTSVPIAAK